MTLVRLAFLSIVMTPLFLSAGTAVAAGETAVIVCPQDASKLEQLGAREILRYVYLRTGRLLPIAESLPEAGDAILIGTDDANLKTQQYRLKTTAETGRRVLTITGGDPLGALYGVYRFAEHLGVRFYLHGDVVPDEQTAWNLPDLDEVGDPLFELRGIQPFHDFPEGPDWWNADDYKAVFSQLAKLRMNFFGLHTYPEGGVGPEPLVWIGQPEDIAQDGAVRFSYPSRHFTTPNTTGSWGYRSQNTSDYAFGADLLFDRDDFGPDYMIGMNPFTEQTTEQANELFNRMGVFLKDIFAHARQLGLKTCIGTETPLKIPTVVQERLRAAGKDPGDPATVQALYEGIFRRIMGTHSLDYYWFWTPEPWTWRGGTDEQVAATVNDLKSALAAAKKTGAPFVLGTCGWVLGPPQDRTLFDRTLPKESPMSCINRAVGFEPVEVGFARIKGRPKWSIPWMEDDPAMIIPQLWAGRMRRDAADAHAYGCTGLMGIHWRTRILGPNVSALAHAAWEQESWNPDFGKPYEPPEIVPAEGRLGGHISAFPNQAIADTEEAAIYQTVRWAVQGYRLSVPNGTYRVTLKFCEPYHRENGKRVFSVKLQGKTVLDRLDIFATVGPDRALDKSYDKIQVTDGWLNIAFTNVVEHPLIAGIVVDGRTADANQVRGEPYTRKINCAGPQWGDYQADLEDVDPTATRNQRARDLPSDDFYADWAKSQFGSQCAEPLAKLFTRLDGGTSKQEDSNLPRPSTWVHGPGGIKPDTRPWEEVQSEYAFVDEMASLRSRVTGSGNLERFDYWLNQFRHLREIGKLNCLWGRFNTAVAALKQEKDLQKRRELAATTAFPIRRTMIEQLTEVHRPLLASVSTWGGIGNVTNWQQHVIPMLLDDPAKELAELLGEPLPQELLQLPSEYVGLPRLIVPTVRPQVCEGERLSLKAIVLAGRTPRKVTIHWRPLGQGDFSQIAPQRVTRSTYAFRLPPASSAAFEYYVRAETADEKTLQWPPTAPQINQTVVVTP